MPLDACRWMWFIPCVDRPCITAALLMATAFAWCMPPGAQAKEPGIPLPDGEYVVDLAWTGEDRLVVLVQHGDGYALRNLELAAGEFTVLAMPRSFLNLKPGTDSHPAPGFRLAPGSGNVAVLEQAAGPLDPHELSLYRLDGNSYEPVAVRGMPREFWLAQMIWDSNGGRLYVAARQYLFPGQEYSIGVVDARTGSFSGVALKANIDLIEQLVFVPARGALGVKCSGFHGEYPDSPMLVLAENGGATTILHAQADELSWHVLASGQLLAGMLPVTGNDSETASNGHSGQWILMPGERELQPIELAFVTGIGALQATADGRWYGFLTHPAQVGVAGGSDTYYLGLQRTADGKTLLTSEPCAAFAFSTDGGYVCAVSEDRATLYLYQLPDSQR